MFYFVALCSLLSCREKSNTTAVEESIPTELTGAEESAPAYAATSPAIETIEDIREAYASVVSKIESNSMDSTYFGYNCNGEKSGNVRYYSENGQLRMIRHTYNEYSHHSATDHYFVKDSTLFFVHFNRMSWSFDSQAQDPQATKDKTTEKRFYIIDNQPVKCLEKSYTTRSAAADNPQAETVANKEVNCPSLDPVLESYRLLVQHRHQQDSISCLED
ncbi:hypothetical protein D770_22750 [Flammeovirgaceae bacterium 311]|nr:hypothetical protein D770_22750 [Flammeovirgaceae bacterium 311]